MIKKRQVALQFFLSLFLCMSFCQAPPFSHVSEYNAREKQREQVIKREENINKRGDIIQDARQEVDVFSPLMLLSPKWKNREGTDCTNLWKRVQSLFIPQPHLQTLPVGGGNVGMKLNVSNISTTSNTSTTTTVAATTTSVVNSSALSLLYPILLPPSSCSSLACKWLKSWQFITVVCITLAWLVGLMALYYMTRTTNGNLLLENCSALCTQDTEDQDEVQAKGIGYFDGSPGLRRFVLIEDEKDEVDEEDNMDDISSSELKDGGSKGDKVAETWKPPRRGTYILQEASKTDVLEVGTYILQEKEEEEKEESDGNRRNNNEVEYILEGATYILQSERVTTGGLGGNRGGYKHIGGIEGMYGIVGREELWRRGYGRIRRVGECRRETEGTLGGEPTYGQVSGIEQLYEILQERVTGERGDTEGGGDDDVLLSVRDLVRTVRRESEERVRENSKTGEGETRNTWKQIRIKEGNYGDQERGNGKRKEREIGGTEVRGRGASGPKKEKGGKGVTETRGEKHDRGVHGSDTWGGRRERGVRMGLRGVGERSWESRPPPPKRAASFPMDHFLSSHLIPRKLSLIIEEESH